MQLVLNETDAENVRRDEFQGREYLVAPVVPIRAMNLDGGYVPKAHVAKSAPAWNGTPVTLNHPRNENGQLVSANSPDVAEKTWLGHLFNNRSLDDGLRTKGELWIDVEHANDLGDEAQQVVEMMENGEPLSVSTSYFADPLPPGEYDGAHREEVAGNLRPDHLAVLPNKEGRCSVDDGCVAGPQANADESALYVAATTDDPGNAGEEAANVLAQARRPEYDGTTGSNWSAPTFSEYVEAYGFEADDVSELSENERRQLADHTLIGEADAETFDEIQTFPVVEPGSRNLNENALMAVLSGRGSQADVPDESLESARTVARNLLEEEFDRDLEENSLTNSLFNTIKAVLWNDDEHRSNEEHATMERNEKIETLVENHGFKEESLEGMGDTCLERTYDSFVENEEDDDPDDVEEQAENDEEESEAILEIPEDELDAVIAERVDERLEANQTAQARSELVEEIVSNSDDFEEEDLSETPVSVLENIRDDVVEEETSEGFANFAAQPGASPNAGGDDSESFPSLTASARIEEVDD